MNAFKTIDTRCERTRDVLVLTLTREPRPTITTDVLDAIERALDIAAGARVALVITSSTEHFAWGANLDDVMDIAGRGDTAPLERALFRYQQTMLRLRHSAIPTVAAVRGIAVSGGCEVLMHCTHVVLHPRSVVGLAEASVGVVPGGGGLKELALRASRSATDVSGAVEAAFDIVAATRLGLGAEQVMELGWLERQTTTIADDPFAQACLIGAKLVETHQPPPSDPQVRVTGAAAARRLIDKQRRARDAGTIGAHQLVVDTALAHVLTGGDSTDELRSEAAMLALEREAFLPLAASAGTQQRFAHLRATGEPLRN